MQLPWDRARYVPKQSGRAHSHATHLRQYVGLIGRDYNTGRGMDILKKVRGHGGNPKPRRIAGTILRSSLIALALLSGCRSTGTVDDTVITKGVKAKLAAVFGPIEDRQIRQFDRGANGQTAAYISVSSINGVVTLTGEVGGERAKAKAGEIARKFEHVVGVNNKLAIAPGYSDDAVNDKPQ